MDGISDAGTGQPMGGAPESAPMATGILDIANEFSAQPEPTQTPQVTQPEPVPQQQFQQQQQPQPAVEQQQQQQPVEPEQEEALDENWFEKLLAEQEQADPIASLLDEQAFAQAAQSPESLRSYAEQVRTALKEKAEQAGAVAEIDQAAQYIGGRQQAKMAFDLVGDLFRGDLPIEQSDVLPEFQSETYADRFLDRVKQVHPDTYDALAVSVLNNAKDVLKANAGYLLSQIGIDPRYIEDYQRVAAVGGFKPTEDVEAEAKWLTEHIPAELHDVFRKLDPEVKMDMRSRPVGVAKRDLEREQYFQRQETESQQRQQRDAQQRAMETEQKSQQALVKHTWDLIGEYVNLGVSKGLNQLEAAGLAMLAYQSIDQQFWEGGEARRVMESFQERLKTGNQLQIDGGRSQLKKVFEMAYRKAAGSYKPTRPTAPKPGPAKAPTVLPVPGQQQQQQFVPQPPPNGAPAAKRIEDIMREYGAIT